MRELYGFDGIIHVSRIVFLEWVALLSVLIFCLLLGLRLDAHIAWSYWFVSLPLWLFYVCVALSAALLWQGFSGNLFRLDLPHLLRQQRKVLISLLILFARGGA